MSHSNKIDQLDRLILEILQSRAKITNARLSEEIGLSPAPTLERVKKLEQSGIITSYHARVDPQKIGLGVSTFVLVSLVGHNKANIEGFITRSTRYPRSSSATTSPAPATSSCASSPRTFPPTRNSCWKR
jgi:Lrp/AsnC family transcriptional regulator, leucine-responsive regulatory protein